jgi:hypothetical protein
MKGGPPKLGLLALVTLASVLAWSSLRVHAENAKKVVKPTLTATAMAQKCDIIPTEVEKFNCYHEGFEQIVDTQGARVALADLAKLNESDDYVKSRCHTLAHHIGHHSYDFYGSVEEANKFGGEICWSGYYHGVMERYMAKYDDSKLMASMPTICPGKTPKVYDFDYYNCLHGVGHGVTIRFGNDIFKALPYCDAIPGSWEQESCYGGVFMQNIVVDQEMHQSVNLKADDPVYPCDAVSENQKSACYLMQTSHILQVNNYDYAGGFKVCDAVEKDYRSTCYQSMGRDISGNFLLDVNQVVTHCALGKASMIGDCYIGAAKNAVFNDRAPANADRLCEKTPDRYRADCVAARNEAFSTL